MARCDALGVAPFSDTPDGLFRAWLTPAFARTQEQVGAWMVEAGMDVRLDPATNLVGRYEGTEPGVPALLIGSHLDSVRDAGRYDGPLGVMLGIECVAALHAEGRRMPFAIEVVGFGDEEGSRFPAPMLTSRALAGTLDPAALDVADADGIRLGQALRTFNPEYDRVCAGTAIPPNEALGITTFFKAARPAGSVLAYLETHIEQGPALEAAGLPVGIVTGIAAQRRFTVTVSGRAGHAGTTAMPLRADALAAAAEMVLAAERIAGDAPDLVATVGRLDVTPGAPNVIPGEARFTLDVRAGDTAVSERAAQAILDRFAAIAGRRGVALATRRDHELPASPCDPRLVDRLSEAVGAEGIASHRLVSGAGHDAMVMAALCPTAMLFVRCAGGISHHPAESVDPADVDVAFRVMRRFIESLGNDHAP